MFNIIEDHTAAYWNGYIYMTLIVNGKRHFLEITNTKRRLINIEVDNEKQGRIILHQLLPSIRKCEQYWEAFQLLQTLFEVECFKEAVFIIRTHNNSFNFPEIKRLSFIYKLKIEMLPGKQEINGQTYYRSYKVCFINDNNTIGTFVGFFQRGFIFISSKE